MRGTTMAPGRSRTRMCMSEREGRKPKAEAAACPCAHEVLPAGTWDRARQVDEVVLDFDQRHRRRTVIVTTSGAEVLIDLIRAIRLKEGDGLCLEEGAVVRVRARPEPLLEIHAHDGAELVRIAWHLGNRHLPMQLLGDSVRVRADHVIADMVRVLGGHVRAVEAPFDPEAGAYGVGHHHHSEDTHDHPH
jgi:urease accessory protein